VRVFSHRWVTRERMKRDRALNLTIYSSTSTPDQSFANLDVSDISLDDSISDVLRPVGLWQ